MSFLQRFLKKILPAKYAAAMEADTRRWILRCRDCGTEHSLWDAGGIRWGGSGVSATRLPCPGCGKITVQTVQRKKDATAP
jgi:hypothetical protein